MTNAAKRGVKTLLVIDDLNFYASREELQKFKDNSLSILTSSIFNLKDIDKNQINKHISEAENELSKDEIDDQKRFILNHKVEVLKSISAN